MKANYPAFKSQVRSEPEPDTPGWKRAAWIVAGAVAAATCIVLTLCGRDALLDSDGGSPVGALLVAIGGPIFILSLAAILGVAAYGICALIGMVWMRRWKKTRLLQ